MHGTHARAQDANEDEDDDEDDGATEVSNLVAAERDEPARVNQGASDDGNQGDHRTQASLKPLRSSQGEPQKGGRAALRRGLRTDPALLDDEGEVQEQGNKGTP